MNPIDTDKYDLEYNSEISVLKFISVGPKGRIIKVIQFIKIVDHDNVYNLGLGDLNSDDNSINDQARSNNKDSEKVLMTVAKALMLFFDRHQNASVVVRGNTAGKTRLYMIKITPHLFQILEEFEMWGSLDNKTWEIYQKNTPYLSLLTRRKFLNNLDF